MAIPVIMPKQGQSVETCIITRWYKNTGDRVKTGDLLFSYETDKAAFELESPCDGFLLETFFDEGAEVPVLMNVAVIGQKGESVSAFIPGKTAAPPAETAPSVKKEEVSKKESAVIQAAVSSTGSRIRISPRAKRLAENKGLNYTGCRDPDQTVE